MTTIYKTANEWLNSTKILKENQFGVEIDTDKVKCGDGTSSWSDLDYTSYTNYIIAEKETVAPEDFGELGEDDTAIVQAALNSGKNVRFTKDTIYNIKDCVFVDSNTVIDGNGATIKVPSVAEATKSNVFQLNNYVKNVTIENLYIEANDREKPGISLASGGSVSLEFTCSNRIGIAICQGVENIVVQNCRFDKMGVCVNLCAGDGTADDDIARKNIVIKNIWATNVSECIDGGRLTEGLYIDGLHVELAPTTDFHHAIYLRTKMNDLRINNFYIKQLPISEADRSANITHFQRHGKPISIYTIGTGEESCSQPVYISNGEIHASTFLASSNPYVIHAENVHFINDVCEDTGAGKFMFNHSEESFGYYTNCTFDNCYCIRNGVFSGCKFKLFEGYSYFMNVAGSHTDNKKVERTIIKDSIIDMNNGGHLIVLDNSNSESGTEYYIEFKNCIVENTADVPVDSDRIVSTSASIQTPYEICINDCNFKQPFIKDLYRADITGTGSLDIKFKRTSLKSNDSGFERTPSTSNISKKYILCDLNGNYTVI